MKRWGPILLAAACAGVTPAAEAPDYLPQDAFRRMSEPQRETIETIRQVAIAIEGFSIDHDYYPGARSGAGWVADLRTQLVPAYLTELPMRDGWGRPLAFWCDGRDYAIVSYGADGLPDRSYAGLVPGEPLLSTAVCGGATETRTRDIVLTAGVFCQWPEPPEPGA